MSIILTERSTDIKNTVDTDEAWVCIKVEPYNCPCGDFKSTFISVQHLIVVWPSEEDPQFKQVLEQSNNGEPVEYEEVFGPCISVYEVEASGLVGHKRRWR